MESTDFYDIGYPCSAETLRAICTNVDQGNVFYKGNNKVSVKYGGKQFSTLEKQFDFLNQYDIVELVGNVYNLYHEKNYSNDYYLNNF